MVPVKAADWIAMFFLNQFWLLEGASSAELWLTRADLPTLASAKLSALAAEAVELS